MDKNIDNDSKTNYKKELTHPNADNFFFSNFHRGEMRFHSKFAANKKLESIKDRHIVFGLKFRVGLLSRFILLDIITEEQKQALCRIINTIFKENITLTPQNINIKDTKQLLVNAIESQYETESDEPMTLFLKDIKDKMADSYPLNGFNYYPSSTIFWVRDYEVTSDEKKRGYWGNFAEVFIAKVPNDDEYTIWMKKIFVESKYHPERDYKKKDGSAENPSFAHPTLRKDKIYENKEDARNALKRLSKDYPNTIKMVTSEDKCYLMIFSEKFPNKLKKFVLKIKENDSGCYFLDLVERFYDKLPNHKVDESFDTESYYLK